MPALLQVKIRCWSCGVKKQGKCGELFAGKAISVAAAAGAAAQAALQVPSIPRTESPIEMSRAACKAEMHQP